MTSVQSTSDRNERGRDGAKLSRTSVNFAIVAPCTTVMTTLLLPSLANRINGRLSVEIGKTTGFKK
jgi:hypothetical protein